MLGVSRGTLRTALDRLEEAGEITRRQGSGTYVGQAVRPTAFHEGLEVLRPYSELAARRGVALSVRDLEVGRAPARRRGGRGRSGSTRTRPRGRSRARSWPTASRWRSCATSCARASRCRRSGAAPRDRGGRDGARRAARARRRRRLRGHARAPAAGRRRERLGRALGVHGATAVLELEEVMHLASGEAVQHSSDVFAPGGIDLQVRRDLEVGRARAARARRRSRSEPGSVGPARGRVRESPVPGAARPPAMGRDRPAC